MRVHFYAVAALLASFASFPSRAAEKPRSAQASPSQPRKVWTNDDLDQLRSRGLISIVGQELAEAPAQVAASPVEPSRPVYNSRLEDPEWYAEKSADLRAEMDKRQAALDEQRTAIALAADRITQPGVAMDKPTAGVTPQSGLALLEAQVQEVQNQMEELSDLARQNNIPAGVLGS